MKAARVAGGLLLAVLAVAGGAWALRGESAPPLRAWGTLEARDARVGSLVGGRVAAVHVEEGHAVVTGQPLVTLETHILDAQIREQRARLAEARAHAARVRHGPREEERVRARVAWTHAEGDRTRMEALLAQGIVGRQAYDAAAAEAASRLELLREAERGSRLEEKAAAEAAVAREEGRLEGLLRQREEAVVRASLDGVVQALDLRPGDLVAPGEGLASLLETGELRARVFVPQTRLGLVRPGQAVLLEVDSHPGRPFPGRVLEVSSRAEYTPRNVQTLEQRAEQAFAVVIAAGPAPELKAGMAVLATFARE